MLPSIDLPDMLLRVRPWTGTGFPDALKHVSELTWQNLLGRAAELNANLEQVVRWLAELGIPMPDIGEQLRRALAQVPRPLGVNCRKG